MARVEGRAVARVEGRAVARVEGRAVARADRQGLDGSITIFTDTMTEQIYNRQTDFKIVVR